MNFEKGYQRLVREVLMLGERRQTRNSETLSVFGKTLVIDELRDGKFPLITGRRMYLNGIVGEMAAFLHGPSHVSDFESRGCNYWKEWADENGWLEVDYGNLWKNWHGINQIEDVLDKLQNNPTDRRMIITGWDPSNLEHLSLPCCHLLYQFYVSDGGYLDMMWYQRSADVMIGIPSDIALAALFVILMANASGLKPGTITMVFGDTHIYADHEGSAEDYIDRAIYNSPTYLCDGDIREFEPHNFKLIQYVSRPKLNFKLHG